MKKREFKIGDRVRSTYIDPRVTGNVGTVIVINKRDRLGERTIGVQFYKKLSDNVGHDCDKHGKPGYC
jgi:hypothetical protein